MRVVEDVQVGVRADLDVRDVLAVERVPGVHAVDTLTHAQAAVIVGELHVRAWAAQAVQHAPRLPREGPAVEGRAWFPTKKQGKKEADGYNKCSAARLLCGSSHSRLY